MVLACGRLMAMTAGLMLSASATLADWQAPKDGAVTEKQLANYLQVQKEALDTWRAAGKAIEGSQSSAAAIALALRTDEKFKASLVSHGMTPDEYSWVGAQVWQAYSTMILTQTVEDAQKALNDQQKTNQRKLDELKQKLATYDKAQKEGRRVMTRDERDQSIASARDEQQAALDEARHHADEAKQAHDDAAKADADAKAADAAAASPPSDVSADDRLGYVDQKKGEAQQARDAAREARDREAEARKAEADARAKAAVAEGRVKNPDLPVTDEEKAQVRKDNDEQIAGVKSEISDMQQGMKLLAESGGAYAKVIQEQQEKNKVAPQNLELLKKHRAEFEQTWGMKKGSK